MSSVALLAHAPLGGAVTATALGVGILVLEKVMAAAVGLLALLGS